MRETILNDLKESMKSQDKERLAVLRMVKAALQMEELNLKRELTDDEVIAVISKQIKTRKESISEFEKASRVDLIDKTQKEIDILSSYLPEQLTEEEIIAIIDEAINEVKPEKPSDMGKVMAYVTPKVKGRADMSVVSAKVKERLNK